MGGVRRPACGRLQAEAGACQRTAAGGIRRRLPVRKQTAGVRVSGVGDCVERCAAGGACVQGSRVGQADGDRHAPGPGVGPRPAREQSVRALPPGAPGAGRGGGDAARRQQGDRARALHRERPPPGLRRRIRRGVLQRPRSPAARAVRGRRARHDRARAIRGYRPRRRCAVRRALRQARRAGAGTHAGRRWSSRRCRELRGPEVGALPGHLDRARRQERIRQRLGDAARARRRPAERPHAGSGHEDRVSHAHRRGRFQHCLPERPRGWKAWREAAER